LSLCRCGCGKQTNTWEQSASRAGKRRGEPRDYVAGHQSRGNVNAGRPSVMRAVRLQQVQELIDAEPGIKLAEVARRLDLSAPYVSRLLNDPDGSETRDYQRDWAAAATEEQKERRRQAVRRYRARQRAACRETSPIDHTTARGADGPRLVAWLEAQGHSLCQPTLTESQMRALLRWRRRGAVADFDAVDRLLTHLSILDFEVPEDIWLDTARGRVA
jgi:predicted transcriptional regulator